jgi:trehalose 6-phosphate synthase/phosphatase
MRQKYQAIKGDRKLIFSVDRLDYTKGVANRLNAFEQFIANYAEYSGKVIFVLVIVPSRHSITKYAERKRIIDEKVGYINSRLGNIGWQPVIYTYGHLSFQELVGLYTVCDLALITPLRDGMNLVCKEFVASRKDGQGVLVLSEMAGAASELTEALLINPNDVQEMASGIKAGLEMSREEQKERMAEMQDRIRHYDVYTWASSFFSELQAVKDLQLEFEFKFLDDTARRELLGRYAGGRKRIFLLDYDGTLVPFSKLPSMAAPGQELLGMLEQLGSNPLNDVFLVSGRDSQTLGKWFAGLPVGLIAEHGAKIRHKDGVWETETMVFSGEWMEKIGRIMEDYVNKCPHAFVERKEFSIAWHYRNADLAEGAIRARELYDDLVKHSAGLSLNILNGNKVIEARIKGIDKGAAVMRILERGEYDFILCIGDDETDEDMFKKLALRPEAYTIKVGNEASFAKYNLYNPSMVQGLLGMIAGGA